MITEKFNRKILSEGRQYGLGFAFLNKLEEGNYETLMPFTACKDYLNDFVYIEQTKHDLDKIYGFKHTYTGILENNDSIYLGVKAIDFMGSRRWEDFNKTQEIVRDNHINVVKYLNKLEEFLNIQGRSELEYFEDDTFVIKVPKHWTEFTFLISLYTLHIRCFINITNEELAKPIEELLNSSRLPYLQEDGMLFIDTTKLLESKYKNNLLDFKYPDTVLSGDYVHSFGISSRINQLKNTFKIAKQWVEF